MVYFRVKLQNKYGNGKNRMVTLSVDEKPGLQALQNKAQDLPPKPGKHKTIGRDQHYKRLGTLSILAALDLHDGHIIVQVHEQHRSKEFITLLEALDAYYPPIVKIRLILDNHSIHTSKETMAYLATKPNRFLLVFTPKHGSWLNIIETLFSKMARTVLREIRVDSKEELQNRILKWVEDVNDEPIVHRWTKFNIRVKEQGECTRSSGTEY